MTRTIRRLVGVYDADGTVVGELAYFVRARLGRGHCALCDITHGRVRERPSWRACREGLPVPFETFHRDDQPAEVRAAASAVPVVLAETTDDHLVVVAERQDLERCAGQPESLVDHINATLPGLDLAWPDDIGSASASPP